MAQLVSDLMTSPPGTTQHSNNLMALRMWAQMAPDSIKNMPVVREVIGSVADANTKRKVSKALNSNSLLGSAL